MEFKPRLDMVASARHTYAAVLALEQAIRQSGLDRELLDLIRIRASQINGCSYCVDSHTSEAVGDGMTARKIFLLSAWRESPLFDDRERAALEWTESLTLIAQTGAPDSAYDAVRQHFSEEQVAQMIIAIGTINLWNRIGLGARLVHTEG